MSVEELRKKAVEIKYNEVLHHEQPDVMIDEEFVARFEGEVAHLEARLGAYRRGDNPDNVPPPQIAKIGTISKKEKQFNEVEKLLKDLNVWKKNEKENKTMKT